MATFQQTKLESNDVMVAFPQPSQSGLNIVLVGPPGAGKGTQANRLCDNFGLQHVATGDLFRENLNRQTPLGQLAKQYMDRGELVPDDVTGAMVKERLVQPDVRQGFVLDGFPRTLPQAEALSEIMADLNGHLDAVLYLKVPSADIITRLSGRWICRRCQTPFHETYKPFQQCPVNQCKQGEYLCQRDDDRPETVRARLQTFDNQTAPLIDYYRKQGLLIEIDGNQPIDQVTDQLISAVAQLVPLRNGAVD